MAIGVRGPATSTDNGETWQWLGSEQVTYATAPAGSESFFYDFTQAGRQPASPSPSPTSRPIWGGFLKRTPAIATSPARR